MNTTSSWAYWTLIYSISFKWPAALKITHYPIFSDLPLPYNIYLSNFTGFLTNFELDSGIHSNMDPHCTCNWSSQFICRLSRWQMSTWRMDVKLAMALLMNDVKVIGMPYVSTGSIDVNIDRQLHIGQDRYECEWYPRTKLFWYHQTKLKQVILTHT